MKLNDSYLQTVWDDLLLSSFFLEEHSADNILTMRDLVEQFKIDLLQNGESIGTSPDNSTDSIFDLHFKRFPFNESIHLDVTPIHFVCGFIPELAQLLWNNVDTPIEKLLPLVSNIRSDTQRLDQNSHHTNLETKHRQTNRAQVGRSIISLNKKLQENTVTNLNWNTKKP